MEVSSQKSEFLDRSATESSPSLINEMLAASEKEVASKESVSGVVIGQVVGQTELGLPLVVVPGADESQAAQAACVVTCNDVGRQCALMFQNGDVSMPIVMGLLQMPVIALGASTGFDVDEATGSIDIFSEREINLHCGDAHFRMTAEGLIEMRGNKVVSHSTGLNRVRGASVKLN